METAGHSDEVKRYLTWAARERLTVVRVLAMARHLFQLAPEAALGHLDALLDRAASHGLYVEVVALADTAAFHIDPAEHLRRVAAICARHPNALLEVANEPYHSTQDPRLHDAEFLKRLGAAVPEGIIVALGAGSYPEAHLTADYVTMHFPRSSGGGGWGHVRDLFAARDLLARAQKPVVNDEPIGAGRTFEPGRRDNSPERFRAAALLSRMLGLGATFHYEGGLQARLPEGVELDCFRAWQQAWTLLPDEGPWKVQLAGEPDAPVSSISGAAHVGAYTAVRDNEAKLLVIGASGRVNVRWAAGWRPGRRITWPQSMWWTAARMQP